MVGTLVTTALCASTALAAKNHAAKLTLAENKVTVAGQPKGVGSTIAPGETIVTGSHSRAEVTLPDGTVVRIGQGSSFSFDGSKLTLNQGSALFNIAGKNAKIVTPALVRTGSAGVVSVHASQSYNALFDLKGSDTVNGTPLVAGQAWVSERGAARTFTFDMQKMVGTSTLVTKFPPTPWVAQTAALASVQHQLIAAIKAQPALVSQRPAVTTAANGGTVVTVGRSGGTPGFLGRLASAFSGKPATAAGTQGGTLQVSGGGLVQGNGTISNGVTFNAGTPISGSTLVALRGNTDTGAGTITLANNTALSASGTSAVTITNTAGGTLTLTKQAVLTVSGLINASAGGVLSLGNGTVATLSAATLNNVTAVNANTVFGGLTNSVGLGTSGAGTLVLNGANTYIGVTAVNPVNLSTNNTLTLATLNNSGTINLTNAGTFNGRALTVGSGNLVFANGVVPGIITITGGSSSATTINGISAGTLQIGQFVNINGTNFTVGTATGTTGTTLLTPAPAAH